jgi:DNA polymerase-3 subunit epsilon
MLHELLSLDRPLISIDLETTGIDPKTDRIVQIGLCKLYPDGKYTEWETLVNPGIPIPPEATEAHKIANVHVQRCKLCPPGSEKCEAHDFTPWPTFTQLASKLQRGLDGCDLCGYNLAAFDVKLLQAEFLRQDIVWTPGRIVDGFKMWQRMSPRNLSAFVDEYVLKDAGGTHTGEALDFTAHNALHDARQTMRGLQGFFLRHPTVPRTVQSLHDMFFVAPHDGALDPDGKLIWKNGEACLGFGQNQGESLKEMKALNPGFLKWILRSDFSPIVKEIVEQALAGKFPVKS